MTLKGFFLGIAALFVLGLTITAAALILEPFKYLFYYILFCGPFFVGCFFYIAKYIWLFVLRQPQNSFYDGAQAMRWWMVYATCIASFGAPIANSMNLSPMEPNGFVSSLILVSMVLWVWLIFAWREHTEVFFGRYELPILSSVES